MRIRITAILFALLLVLGTSACEGKESAPAKADSSSTSSTAAPAKTAVSTVGTPSQITKNFLEAVRGRRYSDIREMLSQRSIDNLNQSASRAGISFDQVVKRLIDKDAEQMAADNVPGFQTQNEEIRGEQATVEAKASNAPQFARISLSKERNSWKINIDETTPAQ